MQPLDRETTDSYRISVEATDGKNPSTKVLPITILDVNDNAPKFSKTSYSGSIEENKIGGNLLLYKHTFKTKEIFLMTILVRRI